MKLIEQRSKGFGTGGRAEVEHETVGTANKNKETPMAGAAVSVTGRSSGLSCTMQT
jgi:hypothetical protein